MKNKHLSALIAGVFCVVTGILVVWFESRLVTERNQKVDVAPTVTSVGNLSLENGSEVQG